MASLTPTKSKGRRTYALLTKHEVTLDIGHVFLFHGPSNQSNIIFLTNRCNSIDKKGLYTIFRELKHSVFGLTYCASDWLMWEVTRLWYEFSAFVPQSSIDLGEDQCWRHKLWTIF